jgi:hypothetical protein
VQRFSTKTCADRGFAVVQGHAGARWQIYCAEPAMIGVNDKAQKLLFGRRHSVTLLPDAWYRCKPRN